MREASSLPQLSKPDAVSLKTLVSTFDISIALGVDVKPKHIIMGSQVPNS